jgi:hypothetical protein
MLHQILSKVIFDQHRWTTDVVRRARNLLPTKTLESVECAANQSVPAGFLVPSTTTIMGTARVEVFLTPETRNQDRYTGMRVEGIEVVACILTC